MTKKMSENTNLPGTPAFPTAEDVFQSFERLHELTDRVLDKLGPPHASGLQLPVKCIAGVKVDPISQPCPPLSSDRSLMCITPSSTVLTVSPLWKSRDRDWGEGYSSHKWRKRSNLWSTPRVPELAFHATNAVTVEGDSEDAVEVRTPRRKTGKPLDRNTYIDLFGSGRGQRGKGKRAISDEYKVVEEVFEDTTTSFSDSSDRSWHAGTEVSPSSCEYLSHLETSIEPLESYSEGFYNRRLTLPRSASPMEVTHQLRSGKSRRASVPGRNTWSRRQEKEQGEQVNSWWKNSRRIKTGTVKRKQAAARPTRDMVKEKETFEPWQKPVCGRKVTTPKEAEEGTRRLGGGTQRRMEKESVNRPRGMKKFHVPTVSENEVVDMQGELHIGNEKASRHGQDPNASAHEKGMKGGRNFMSPGAVPVGGDNVPRQHPRKERAHTPSSDSEQLYFSPNRYNRSGEKQRRRSSPRSHDSSNSPFEVEGAPSRGRVTSNQRRHQGSVDSRGSFESESPTRVDKNKRQAHEGRGRRRRDKSAEGSRHRTKRDTLRGVRSEESKSDSSSDGSDRLNRQKPGGRNLSAMFQRFQKNGRDYSHDSEDSYSSSSDEGCYGVPGMELKAKKAEVDSPRAETRKRKERQKIQEEREMERATRERQGLKGHYLSVNQMGIPYGFGVGAWRLELTKLCQGLDPSVTNIRCQPEEKMATLRRRLKDSFEYSAPVDRAYIRKLAGKVVTQRRSRLVNSMKDGEECPAGFDKKIWRRLYRIRRDPHREELSQRMKYANASRVNKGRTGPKGEDGTREDLQRKLGREPHPDEVQMEMRRKKGYEGVSKKRRSGKLRQPSPFSDKDDSEAGLERTEGVGVGALTVSLVDGGCQTVQFEAHLLENMKKELEELRAEMRAVRNSAVLQAIEDGEPSTSVHIGGPESNATGQLPTNMTAGPPERGKEKVADDCEEFRASPQKKKLRSAKKP